MPVEWFMLHAGALGDLVLSLQTALRVQGFRDARRRIVAARADVGNLEDAQPAIERLSLESLGTAWLFAEDNGPAPPRLAECVAGRCVLNFLDRNPSRVHSRLAQLRPARLLSVDTVADPKGTQHVTRGWQRQLESQSAVFETCSARRCKSTTLCPSEFRVGAGCARLAQICGESCGTRIVIHPGSGGRSKCWPLGAFLEVARRLREAGHGVLFVSGEVEAERENDGWRASIESVAPLAGPCSVDELLEILAACDGFVGNDAGPSHLAALLGRPTLTLFGPTDAGVWRPLGGTVRVLAGDCGAPDGRWGVSAVCVVEALLDLVAASRQVP